MNWWIVATALTGLLSLVFLLAWQVSEATMRERTRRMQDLGDRAAEVEDRFLELIEEYRAETQKLNDRIVKMRRSGWEGGEPEPEPPEEWPNEVHDFVSALSEPAETEAFIRGARAKGRGWEAIMQELEGSTIDV